jgi:6-pyruvoyltetrahydropterin/6-carboxytetrahydropterin synthase
MQATVCKVLDFPAAHQNTRHVGHCSNVHGHTWTLEIHCHGAVDLKNDEAPNYGMVIDFGDIKDVYREHVEPFVEHRFLNDTLTVLEEFTTELIAGWIYNQMKPHLPTLYKIRLWEGKTSYAEVKNGDMMR